MSMTYYIVTKIILILRTKIMLISILLIFLNKLIWQKLYLNTMEFVVEQLASLANKTELVNRGDRGPQ